MGAFPQGAIEVGLCWIWMIVSVDDYFPIVLEGYY